MREVSKILEKMVEDLNWWVDNNLIHIKLLILLMLLLVLEYNLIMIFYEYLTYIKHISYQFEYINNNNILNNLTLNLNNYNISILV